MADIIAELTRKVEEAGSALATIARETAASFECLAAADKAVEQAEDRYDQEPSATHGEAALTARSARELVQARHDRAERREAPFRESLRAAQAQVDAARASIAAEQRAEAERFEAQQRAEAERIEAERLAVERARDLERLALLRSEIGRDAFARAVEHEDGPDLAKLARALNRLVGKIVARADEQAEALAEARTLAARWGVELDAPEPIDRAAAERLGFVVTRLCLQRAGITGKGCEQWLDPPVADRASLVDWAIQRLGGALGRGRQHVTADEALRLLISTGRDEARGLERARHLAAQMKALEADFERTTDPIALGDLILRESVIFGHVPPSAQRLKEWIAALSTASSAFNAWREAHSGRDVCLRIEGETASGYYAPPEGTAVPGHKVYIAKGNPFARCLKELSDALASLDGRPADGD